MSVLSKSYHTILLKKERTNQKQFIKGWTRKALLWGGIAVLIGITAAALMPSVIASQSPPVMQPDQLLQPPGSTHFFGTDQLGRDVFSLIVYGSAQSLFIGVASVLVGGFIGTLISLIGGYFGGILDMFLMRCIDILMTIPGILLAITVSALLSTSLTSTILAVSIAMIPNFARVMRSQVIAVKNRLFIKAAISSGASHAKIIITHILPHCMSPLLVMATIGMGTSILIGAGLSFLGLSEIKELPDWGYLLSQGRSYLNVAWWVATFPGLAITILVLSVNLIGDELRAYFDPRG
ncbi:ABC transporter permease [Alkalicoccobacillus porphyridii]|uniref:ABC transporter permease n=1 Tax=Alkalicoccobacillus porphyridii TaxID=2597270 RepID=A0A554A2C8_9BACI|nr:ABC transporter permease [Alkalicoccobacillus porphyridii]TSB47847.1 ABC transporter permease [Alkalicoccobacillus porphyridii]